MAPGLVVRFRDLVESSGRVLTQTVQSLLGDFRWAPPPWLRAVAGRTAAGYQLARSNPRPTGLAILALLALGGGSYGAWRWYQAQPKPVTIELTVTAPARTCYECDQPGNPNPLVLTFAGSVAPLEAIGKPLDAHKSGLKLNPGFAGDWNWVDEHTLRFQPRGDWPIGQSYEIAIPRRGLVAAHILLARYSVEFMSPPFTAKVDSSEFYQDPVQATDKRFATTLAFSHPVDPLALEQRISLTFYDRITDKEERKVEPSPPFTVTYDKLKLHAYVHAGQLPVPEKAGRAVITVDSGVKAARGGNSTKDKLTAGADIPGRNSLDVAKAQLQIVRDERDEPSQALMIETSHSVTEQAMKSHVTAWLLPERNPDPSLQAAWERSNAGRAYPWNSPTEVTGTVLNVAQRFGLEYVANEREHVELHSFRLKAAPGRYLYVRIEKGLESFGGYRMPEATDRVLAVPAYPQELQIAQSGSLLALSGQKKLTIFSRDVPAFRVQVGRLLPNQLQHLVSQSTRSLSSPEWLSGSFSGANITERFTSIVNLPPLEPGEPHYEVVNLSEYLSRPGESRLGIFLLSVQAWDTAKEQPIAGPDNDSCDDCGYIARQLDTRLILVTDLGLLVKKSQDGSQDVFVQSIQSGEPVAGATVEVMGRNGDVVLSETSDDAGHVRFPDLNSFKQERKPVLYAARRGGDLTFLPMDDRAHALDFSRFDVGGVANVADENALTAYLFSDRGMYRPGDEIRAGVIIKSQDWRALPAGLPLMVDITDPRGVVVRRDTIKLSAAGFEDIRYTTRETAPAGNYTIRISVIKDEYRQYLIGSLAVTVREFLPDRLKMVTHLSSESAEGWVSPEHLSAAVTLENLFGTPATGRRVTGSLRLSPSFPSFARYKDYQFRDPQAAKEGFNETLTTQTTDAKGQAAFDLGLQRFAPATYRVAVTTQGFEADGGRGVTNEVTQLVSDLPFLVGWKADGDLAYVSRDSMRSVTLMAVNPALKPIDVQDLVLDRIERRYVSMLIKQDNGTYRYESRLKETPLGSDRLGLRATGTAVTLGTGAPGSYSYVVHNNAGQVFARVDFVVAGGANLTRSLEKNAELQITLDKKDYAPGEDIEMQILAPYTGAGLITIERDRVVAWRWFRTTTTSSIQKIRIPPELEGNAYVQVTFVRDPSSPEIYSSPLSFGIQPFSIALSARRNTVALEVPDLTRPGVPLTIRYRTEKPARIVLFAVDEGILQVAGYKTPDPLGYFYAKRAHAVVTRQILDLILPEFRDAMLAAPGGDEGGALGRHLNPFKRKTDKPVAWWSGIVDADATTREVRYMVPDYFNGRLRVMAVAVGTDTIGVAERDTVVRGDFVLSPNVPLTVTPGDEFDVSVGVANNVKGSGADAKVEVSIQPSAGLQVVGSAKVVMPISERAESSARFHVRAGNKLGSASLTFKSTLATYAGKASATLSVRPATPYWSALRAGVVKGSETAATTRTLYPQFRTLRASISPLPLTLAHGLSSYLEHYPYSCTEQVVSQAIPALVLADRPEFRYLRDRAGTDPLAGLIDELRIRQNSDGAYRYWPGGVQVIDYVSVYAQHLLLDIADHGHPVPKDLIENGNGYLRQLASRDGNNLADERTSAYAIYLLARQGLVVSNEAAALQKRLSTRYADQWTTDLTAAYVAAAYQLMKQHDLAGQVLAPLFKGVKAGQDQFHTAMVADGGFLYLVARHFPDRLARLPAALVPDLVKRVQAHEYQSLSAATTILALDAYAAAAGPKTMGALSIAALQKNNTSRSLALPPGLFPRVDFPATSTALRFGNDSKLPAYYTVEEAGFDLSPPSSAVSDQLEVIREYLGTAGTPVADIKVGDEVTVRVRFRATRPTGINDLVLVDLLPGGFDLVMPTPTAQSPERLAASPTMAGDAPPSDEVAGEGDEASPDNAQDDVSCGCAFLWARPPGFPDYADMREDRVVLYGRATSTVQEFTYRIKATSAGTFATPPAYGESMYDWSVRAHSLAGRLTVQQP